jgi:hypothetical protein
LSTAPEASLRNGNEALTLAQKAINSGAVTPEAVIVLVAAQAENGDFAAAKSNALALARQLEAAGDPRADMVKNEVLAAIEAGRPIRNAGP